MIISKYLFTQVSVLLLPKLNFMKQCNEPVSMTDVRNILLFLKKEIIERNEHTNMWILNRFKNTKHEHSRVTRHQQLSVDC